MIKAKGEIIDKCLFHAEAKQLQNRPLPSSGYGGAVHGAVFTALGMVADSEVRLPVALVSTSPRSLIHFHVPWVCPLTM